MNRKFPSILMLAVGLTPCLASYSYAQADTAEALWTQLDRNESGWLSGNELNGGWVIYDTDADGEVTRAEFMAGRAAEALASQPKPQQATGATSEADRVKDAALFVKLDTSGEGYLDGGELQDDTFKRYDANADGRVVLAEFAAGRAKDRQAAATGGATAAPVRAMPATAPNPATVAPKSGPVVRYRPPVAAPASVAATEGGAWRVGQQIEAYVLMHLAWEKATIMEIGTGEHQGQYLVRVGTYNPLWVAAKNMRTGPPPPEALGPPRAGKYRILGTGGKFLLQLGYFVLSGGNQYRVYDMNMKTKPEAAGRYRFDTASQSVVWLTGPYKEAGWGGYFQSSFQGAKHSIIINRAVTAENIKE